METPEFCLPSASLSLPCQYLLPAHPGAWKTSHYIQKELLQQASPKELWEKEQMLLSKTNSNMEKDELGSTTYFKENFR